MAWLIDSGVIIDLDRRSLPPDAVAAIAPGESVALAAITASELLVGVHRARTPEPRRQRTQSIEEIFDQILGLPFDLSTARHHAVVGAGSRAGGRMIGSPDLLIGATALAHGCEVISYNAREFERVPGLVLRRMGR